MEKNNFKLIVGLGNPGNRYKGTYHNIGMAVLERIAGKERFKKPFSVWKGKPFIYLKGGNRVYVKPLLFMNESGRVVSSAMKHFNVKSEEILIIHDDSDIETGSYKLSYGAGSAGHNGIKSIIECLGTEGFWRLRIGIRGMHVEKAGDFVLQKISPRDKEKLEEALSKIQTSYSE
ncbi:MAG: aminoacyl-tRNA hydrolase [Parcubacteria group bacterium]